MDNGSETVYPDYVLPQSSPPVSTPNNINSLKYLNFKKANTSSLNSISLNNNIHSSGTLTCDSASNLTPNISEDSLPVYQQNQTHIIVNPTNCTSTYQQFMNNNTNKNKILLNNVSMPLSTANLVYNPTNSAATTNTTIITASSSSLTQPHSAIVMINSLNSNHQTILNTNSFNTDNSLSNNVAIMMKPISTSTTLLPTNNNALTGSTSSINTKHKNSTDKFVNIGIESIKLNGAVPFKQLRNPLNLNKDISKENLSNKENGIHQSNLSNKHPSFTTTTTTTTTIVKSNDFLNKFSNPSNNSILAAQQIKQLSNKFNESGDDLSLINHQNNNTNQINKNHQIMDELEKPQNEINSKNSQLKSNNEKELDINSNNIYTNKNGSLILDVSISGVNSNCGAISGNGQSDNENSALCQSPPRTIRSSSNFSNRKEKKSSVGYRLGKRKLLFEKRRQISDYALIFAMTGVLLMIIETEFSMAKLYNKVKITQINI